MQQHFHTTLSRRALLLVGLVGLAIVLGLSGGAFAGEGTLPGGKVLTSFGSVTELTLEVKEENVHVLGQASEGVVPQDLAQTQQACYQGQ